jgi:fatty-acyl-CoA synthase
VSLPTSGSLLAAILGAQWIAAIPVVVDHAVAPPVMASWLGRLGCTTIVADEAVCSELVAEGLRALPPSTLESYGDVPPVEESSAEDIAYLQLTSGTTGEPQASAISHRALASQIDGLASVLGARADDDLVSWLPLYHDMGLVGFVFYPLRQRRPCHLLPPSLRSLPRWLSTIDDEGGTITASPDFGYRAASLLEPDAYSLATLRFASIGAEPVRRRTIESFEARFGLGPVVRPSYGLGEATLAVTISPPGSERTWTDDGLAGCGRPLPGVEVEVRDDRGRPCTAGVTGQVHVRGETLLSGYWRDEAATGAAVVDGWLATGDLGHVDERGELFISGRIRAMIKRSGHLIPARAVEELADQVPGVMRSAAFGAEGQREALVLVAEQFGTSDDRAEIVRSMAQAVQAGLGFPPDRVHLLRRGGIPITGSGKIRYDELRRLHGTGELEPLPLD